MGEPVLTRSLCACACGVELAGGSPSWWWASEACHRRWLRAERRRAAARRLWVRLQRLAGELGVLVRRVFAAGARLSAAVARLCLAARVVSA